MITEFDVYAAFRRAQADKNERGYRLPKDWEKAHQKMTEFNRNQLYKMTVHFNTTYSKVNIDKYMACGFELWKGFTYKYFCDNRILELYITKDKNQKRKLNASREEIEMSFQRIASYLMTQPIRQGYSQLQSYCKFRTGEVRSIVEQYIRGDIDNITMMYCIHKKYITLTDDERASVPYISKRYRETIPNVLELSDFIEEKEAWLNERTREQAVS